ncbi:MAG: helix-turn-helix transcriptional regulator [Clostridia bacterium]|nr:helix-turn-helix transcriptional regulator [Clostridia bacterium]
MMKKQTSGESLAKAAQKYIETHSKDKFSLDEMAGALYVNGSYLLRTFKRFMNMTPLCYHHLVRCNKAKELLNQTDMSISQVGETVGFVSSSHFSHVFRKTEGCTPSEYRILHQRNGHEETEQ